MTCHIIALIHALIFYGLFTNDNAISDNKSWERHGEGSGADSENDCQTAEICDLAKSESLHHWTAYKTETACYCSIKMKN